jgi:hypothetical protein
MRFPEDLEAGAFRSRGGDGEYAWRRLDAERAAGFLAASGVAILGGEIWQVHGREIWPGFVGSDGIPGMYQWSTDREGSEPWDEYVALCLAESLAAIRAMPDHEYRPPEGFEVVYNLTWADQERWDALAASNARRRRPSP